MRVKYLLLVLVVFAIALGTTSCGTIFIGARENIAFTSNLPSNTPVRLVIDGEQIGHRVCFPINVSVKRGYRPSFAIAETDGYETSSLTIRKKFHPAILANLLIGGIYGIAVDLGCGAVSQAEKKSYEFYFTKLGINNNDVINNTPQKQEVETVYKIGDFYSVTGKRGVVVSVSDDGRHGKIISLKQTIKIWGKKKKCYIADNQNSGFVNLNSTPANDDVPAIYWCMQQGDKWYLPSINEMKVIYQNIDVINSTLEQYGGSKILPHELYWTSTENSKTDAIAIQSSYHRFLNKSEFALVVAMAEF